MNHRNATLAAAAALFVPAYLGIFSSGVPTILGPLPALTTLPAFFSLTLDSIGLISSST